MSPDSDNQEWAEAYQKEFQGFEDRGVFATVRPPKGVKILGTNTCLDYKIDNGVLDKQTVRMCALGNHQSEDSFNASDIYSPVLKAPEARLLADSSIDACQPP